MCILIAVWVLSQPWSKPWNKLPLHHSVSATMQNEMQTVGVCYWMLLRHTAITLIKNIDHIAMSCACYVILSSFIESLA